MENNEKVVATDEPKTKHRGIKAMPFVIGRRKRKQSRVF